MIIGLDLSLTHTGWVIIDKNKVLEYGTIVPKKLRKARRLNFIRNHLFRVIKKYNPVLAVIENYAYSPRANMAFSIGENGGVIKLMLWRRMISYVVVAPKTLKKFVTKSGNASKVQMQKVIKSKWSVKFNTEHEFDAFALAKMGCYILSRKFGDLDDKRFEAIKTVLSDVTNKNEKGRRK